MLHCICLVSQQVCSRMLKERMHKTLSGSLRLISPIILHQEMAQLRGSGSGIGGWHFSSSLFTFVNILISYFNISLITKCLRVMEDKNIKLGHSLLYHSVNIIDKIVLASHYNIKTGWCGFTDMSSCQFTQSLYTW